MPAKLFSPAMVCQLFEVKPKKSLIDNLHQAFSTDCNYEIQTGRDVFLQSLESTRGSQILDRIDRGNLEQRKYQIYSKNQLRWFP